MAPDVTEEAAHLVDVLRAELRLYGRFGRPVHLGHIARGLDSLQEMLTRATASDASDRRQSSQHTCPC